MGLHIDGKEGDSIMKKLSYILIIVIPIYTLINLIFEKFFFESLLLFMLINITVTLFCLICLIISIIHIKEYNIVIGKLLYSLLLCVCINLFYLFSPPIKYQVFLISFGISNFIVFIFNVIKKIKRNMIIHNGKI